MNPISPKNPPSAEIEQLLCRNDIWRGYSCPSAPTTVVDSGYGALNDVLQGGGWPIGGLVEVCQSGLAQAEWLLLTPTLSRAGNGLLVLINPPCEPFAQGLIKAGINLDRVVVIESSTKANFLSSFIELTRTRACDVLLAWQPKQNLSYSELRKCLLATKEGLGLYVLFRPSAVQVQSSPATLRVNIGLQAKHLKVSVLKQRGALGVCAKPVLLPLPDCWQGLMPHYQLDITSDQVDKRVPRMLASVPPMHGGRHGRN